MPDKGAGRTDLKGGLQKQSRNGRKREKAAAWLLLVAAAQPAQASPFPVFSFFTFLSLLPLLLWAGQQTSEHGPRAFLGLWALTWQEGGPTRGPLPLLVHAQKLTSKPHQTHEVQGSRRLPSRPDFLLWWLFHNKSVAAAAAFFDQPRLGRLAGRSALYLSSCRWPLVAGINKSRRIKPSQPRRGEEGG